MNRPFLPLIVAAAVLCGFWGCGQKADLEEAMAGNATSAAWRDPESCRECHLDVFENWLQSHHANANRDLDGPRDAERFAIGQVKDAAGREYRLREGDGVVAIEESLGGGEVDSREVKGFIGTYPLEQALVEGSRGRLQAHGLAWDPVSGEWFNVFGSEERLRGEWGHWTGQGMNWNSNCAWCHTTEYQKNYNPVTDSYQSRWERQGISCISCHDGMEEHIAMAERGEAVPSGILDTRMAMENCASCHSRREELTDGGFSRGERFDDHFRLTLYDHPTAYFADGKAREEDFVYGSFVHSKMGHAGVSCLDCHEPHSASLKLPATNNALCIQCHATGEKGASVIDQATHSRHPLGSNGSLCVECHMPERVYMDRDPRRDHGFTIPDPWMTLNHGVPNACSACHQDQDTESLLEYFEQWYGGSERVVALRERADLLAASWSGQLESPNEIIERLRNESNPYWTASWLRLLGPFSGNEKVEALGEAYLQAEQPVVRAAALALVNDTGKVVQGLSDASRLARLEASARLVGASLLRGESLEEYRAYLEANADRPSGALQLATLAAQFGDASDARRWVELAVSFDRRNPSLRHDAAILLDRVGLVEDAMRQLRIARSYDRSSGRYAYAMGLLLGEQGRNAEALEQIENALALEPDQDRWLFNAAVLRSQAGDVDGAISDLERAVELNPADESYRSFLESLRSR